MEYKIAVLKGDGIGPEIVDVATKVLEKIGEKLNRMSRVIVSMSEANLLASLLKLQRILNFYSLRNLASNELFLQMVIFKFFNFIFILKS